MTKFFVRHPVSTWMIFTAFIVLGVYALPRLQIEAIPEVDLPRLTVVTSWTGASPQAMQRSVTLPIEESVRRVHGIEKVESTSRNGRSTVEISFRRDIDIDFARLELNEQLGAIRRDLPQGAGQPNILPYVPQEFRTEEFFTVNIESDLPTNELRDRAESWILPQVLAVEGVADANIQGGALPLIKVKLDRRKLDLYDITADAVFTALDALDELAGAGVVRQSGMERLVSLRDPVKLRSLEQAVVLYKGGRNFRLGELATVENSFEDPQYFVRANLKNVVQVAVEKRSGSNTVAVSRALRDALPQIEEALPFEASFFVVADQGRDLEEKLQELVIRSLVILGLLFALLALTLRQVRLTGIVVGSILFAVVISLSLFYFFRISVNFITISGLTVCFGLILDNSILVLDSIHRRLGALDRAEEAKLTRRAKLKVAAQTVIAGTRDVTFPIFATTLTTVVAFVSFIFLSGRLSLYYVPLAISVATAMVASIFVAFGWLPVVLNQAWAKSVVGKHPDGEHDIEDDAELSHFVEDTPDLDSKLAGWNRLFYTLQRGWWAVIPILAVGFFFSWKIYDEKVIKGGFWGFRDPEEIFMYVQMPAGTQVNVTGAVLSRFEETLDPIPDGVRVQTTAFGNNGFMRIEFEDQVISTYVPTFYRELLVEQADKTGGSAIFIRGFSQSPYMKGRFGGSSMNSLIKLTGYNTKTLNEIAEKALAQAKKSRRARNAAITSGSGFRGARSEDEAVIYIHRTKLAEYGFNLAQVAGYVRRLLGVDTPWRMLIDGDQEQVELSYADAESIDYADVAEKMLTSPTGERVRLGDLITLRTETVAEEIRREDQRYTVNINWEYVGTDRMRSQYIKDILDGMELPYGYDAEEGEQEFFTQEEEEDLRMMVVLAAVFIFMILAALFESVSLPFLVILSLPMALIGVVLIFWLTSTSFDSSAYIGLVLLFGIVVNNAILLVSRYRTEAYLILKAKLGGDPASSLALFSGIRKNMGGSDLYLLPKEERASLLRRAIARGTSVRMRSILLTSGTTIIGLLPLLLSIGSFQDQDWWVVLWEAVKNFGETEGDIWENLALSSIGGLVASMVLLIFTLPVLYYFVVRVGWMGRRFAERIQSLNWTRRPHSTAEETTQ